MKTLNGKALRKESVVELKPEAQERYGVKLAIVTNVNPKAWEVENHEAAVNTTEGYILVSDLAKIVPADAVL